MNEDGQGVAVGSVACRDDKDCAGLVGGIAGGEVGNTAACVAVPGASAEPAGGRNDVCDGHVSMTVGVEDPVGIRGDGDGGASAVCSRGGGHLGDLREVHGDAEDSGRQRDGCRLAYDGAGTALAKGDSGFFAAARDRDTERNREKKQED